MIYRSKESASPFSAVQTVAKTAEIIGVPVSAVIAQMALRSRPGAMAGSPVDFSTAETLLRVFQDEV